MLLALVGFSSVFSQAYKRHALIEEGTGTWCQYCPWGAYTIDSMERYMGEHLVAISWHGPKNYGEPLYIPKGQCDTVASYAKATGYPWAYIGRTWTGSGSYQTFPNPWYSTAIQQASEAPVIDFRVVNAVYKSNSVDFDVDVTPFDLSNTPTEDTCGYLIITALTEDGIVSSQTKNGVGQVDNFVHRNVARAVGGKVLGDVFTLGTKTAVQWPVRKHYHMVTNGTANGIDWVQDSLRIKAFAVLASKKTSGEAYLDAGQTGYVTTLPSSAAPAVWTVLPQTNSSISGDSANLTIVWSKGGGAGAKVNLNYSLDNGKTWLPIASSISTTTYFWKIATAAYGQQVMIQVVDGSDATIKATSGTFSIGPKPNFQVMTPKGGDVAYIGATQAVTFTPINNPGENITISLSRDSMATWTKLASVNAATSYPWAVKGPATTTAFLKVSDGVNATGYTGMFSIVDSGKITVTVDGTPLAQGASTVIHWISTGYLGETVDVDASYDGKQSWAQIAHGLPSSTTSQNWTAPMKNVVATIRVMAASGATGYSSDFSVGSAGVSQSAPGTGITISPNPLSSASTITYDLSAPATVTFIVHDLLGREVARVNGGALSEGSHEMSFEGSNLAAGTYEYTLLAGKQSYRGKLSIIR